MFKFIKFYYTGSSEVVTFFTAEKTVQNDGQTHEFTSAEDAKARSTSECFIFWDNEAVGAGSIAE